MPYEADNSNKSVLPLNFENGMSKREYMVTHIMSALISKNVGDLGLNVIATLSVKAADALIEALNNG